MVILRIPQSMSLRKIETLRSNGYGIQISYVKVSQLLTDIGYSKQVDQKMLQANTQSSPLIQKILEILKTTVQNTESPKPPQNA